MTIWANVEVIVQDANAPTTCERQAVRNLVVDAGLNLIRDRIAGTSSAYVTHLAVGTSATAVTAAQTTMSGEVFRGVLTEVITSSSKQAQFKYYLASGDANGNTLREIGLFTASSGGTMVARAVLASPIVKTASTTVTFSWTLTFGTT